MSRCSDPCYMLDGLHAIPRQKPSVMPGRPRSWLRTLMQRFSGACCSRSCERSRSAHAHAARTLTQRARSLFLVIFKRKTCYYEQSSLLVMEASGGQKASR